MSKKKQRLIRIALEDYEAQVDQMYENLIFELSIALHLKEDTVRRALPVGAYRHGDLRAGGQGMSQRPKGFPRSAWFHMSQRERNTALWFIYWACAAKFKLTYGRIENASLQ